ncbi:MAG: hypothetical protein J6D34_11560 [Atopobiaceae bacterium]|nr:hypothetical protein [Atopobiaceae bacterium]
MKKFNKVIALAACALLTCLVVVGCGNKEAYKADFVGTWEIVETENKDETVSEEDIDLLKSLGMNVYAEIHEDGTCTLEPFGSVIEGTWDVASKGKATMAAMDQSIPMTIEEDGHLFLENENGQGMRFKKIDPSEKKESVIPEELQGTVDDAVTEVVDDMEAAEGDATAADEAKGDDAAGATEDAAEATEDAAKDDAE